jgi:2-keto-4-pentenoate hydratase
VTADDADIEQAAGLLWNAEQARVAIPPLTESFQGRLDVEAAWRIQSVNRSRALAAGKRIVGYKVGLTSAAMQEQMGVNEPDFGALLDSMELLDGVLHLDDFVQARVEAEIALRLKADLGPGVTPDDVLAATEAALPSLEIIDSRIRDWKLSLIDTVADNASSGAFIIGAPAPGPIPELGDVAVSVRINGVERATGLGAAALGHPAAAAAWLSNRLNDFGIEFPAGSVVLTGSLHASLPVVAGDSVDADFGAFGSVHLDVR